MRTLAIVTACALLGACASRPETLVRTRYADGRLASERGYSYGEKQGVNRGWWPSGARKFECRYAKGLAVGTCREWYESGRLATVRRYVNGVERGLQEGWGRRGEVQFSYVVRDGRRYGLLGAINCRTGVRTPGEL